MQFSTARLEDISVGFFTSVFDGSDRRTLEQSKFYYHMRRYISKSIEEKVFISETERQILGKENLSLESFYVLQAALLEYDFNFFSESVEQTMAKITQISGLSATLKAQIFQIDFGAVRKSVFQAIGMKKFEPILTFEETLAAIETNLATIDGHPQAKA